MRKESLFSNLTDARQHAAAALDLSTGRDAQYGTALALAFAGDEVRAQALADDLSKRFPEDTVVQFNYLPTIHAQLALVRDEASKAIERLQAASPFEWGSMSLPFALYPVFVRGNAFLATGQGKQAATEFQKILEWRGVGLNEPVGPPAHLGLARSYSLQSQLAQGAEADAARTKARAAYQDFLSLRKDADPDIPILKQAKAEYAKLQ